MYGAVSNQILAQTIQENIKIFRFSGPTSSAVHVNNIDCEHDTAILGMIAVNISRAVFVSAGTVRYKPKNEKLMACWYYVTYMYLGKRNQLKRTVQQIY